MAAATDIQSVMQSVTELREAFEAKSVDLEKIERIEASLEEFETKNQETVKELKLVTDQAEELKSAKESLAEELEASNTARAEVKGRMDDLEAKMARAGGKRDVSHKETEEYKNLNEWCTKGPNTLNVETKATLRTDVNAQGGFLVQTESDDMIIKKITETSAVRSISRVKSTASKTLEMPKRGTLVEARFEGEFAPALESISNYESESITTLRLAVQIAITNDLLMNAAFDMESEILSDAAERFAQKEGNKFVVGTGAGEPEGFQVNAAIRTSSFQSTAAAGTFQADDIITITGRLKVGYNPQWALNRLTLAFIRAFKSTTGSYLWQPGINGVVANTLAGHPYIIAPDMPSNGSDVYSVAFGDFTRGYTITDRLGTTVIRDELTLAQKNAVVFNVLRFLNGGVTNAEAITMIQCSS